MKKIILSGEIGWDVTPFGIREQLNGSTGDLEVDVSGPGGDLFDGIEIFNLFRDYKRNNPEAQMILNIKGLAASMMSYISSSSSFDLVTVEDNATYMIHNPVSGVYGDYQDMEEMSDFLKRLAGLMSMEYIKRSGKTKSEVLEMMDKTTWIIGGQEIVDAGFADEVMKTENNIDKAKAYAINELKFKAVMKKVREREINEKDFNRVAAMITDEKNINKKTNSTQSADGGNNSQEEFIMKDSEELKSKNPEIHAEVMKAGEDQEKQREQARKDALYAMKEKDDFKGIKAIHDRIDQAIKGTETIEDVNVAIVALSMKKDNSAAIDSNEIGDIDSGDSVTVSGEAAKDPKDLKAKW